jgi:lysophospholipase L1-like esterase
MFKNRVRFVVIIIALVISANALIKLLVFCTGSFLTTVVAYGLSLIVAAWIFTRNVRLQGLGLFLISSLFLLFISEVLLRFVRMEPITYTEMHGKGYVSMYRTDVLDNWHVLRGEERKDIHTLEWAPSEVRSNTTLDFQFPDYRCNAKGLRGNLPRPYNRVILAAGDSFTEGVGTPCDSTYPKLLECSLRADDTSWAVINAGVSGNDPFFDWMMLKKLRTDYPIEKVVFLINTTDVNDVQMRGGMARFLPSGELDYPEGPWWEPLYAVSFVSRLFFHGVLKVERNLMTSEEHLKSMNHAVGLLARLFSDHIVPYAEENGIAIYVVLHPMADETRGQATVYEMLRDALNGVQGLSFTDCMADIADHADPQSLYWPNDRHFKPDGYARLAQCVYGRNFADHDSSASAE